MMRQRQYASIHFSDYNPGRLVSKLRIVFVHDRTPK